MGFPLAYLNVTLANSKDQDNFHAHFHIFSEMVRDTEIITMANKLQVMYYLFVGMYAIDRDPFEG